MWIQQTNNCMLKVWLNTPEDTYNLVCLWEFVKPAWPTPCRARHNPTLFPRGFIVTISVLRNPLCGLADLPTCGSVQWAHCEAFNQYAITLMYSSYAIWLSVQGSVCRLLRSMPLSPEQRKCIGGTPIV